MASPHPVHRRPGGATGTTGTTGTPTDIGHAIAWLCSDYARLITGIDLVVDGGARAKNFAYTPAAPDQLAGPRPVINLDATVLEG